LRFPRLHLAEIHDQPWCPAILRDALTEWLRALWDYSEASRVIAPVLRKVIDESGAHQVIDLCSGGSGPLISLQRELRMSIVMTDKFPSRHAMDRTAELSHREIIPCYESIDAAALPAGMRGFRTLFNSFHHFRPKQAGAILMDACRNAQPIGIFEITQRTFWKTVLSFPASTLSCYLLIFRMRPRRPAWWLLTWIFPVIPLMIGWDGFVSHLRSYTRSELLSIADRCPGQYQWETGKLRAPKAGVVVNYLTGIPAR
jgi:hypothetical protein